MYNFLELPPEKLRYIFRLMLQFDLACNKLGSKIQHSDIAKIRENQLTEGFNNVRLTIHHGGMKAISEHLATTQGAEFLELNPYTQMTICTYENAVEAAKDWLVYFLEVPLWVISKEIDEAAKALTAEHSDDAIAQFFANLQDCKTRPLALEVVAA